MCHFPTHFWILKCEKWIVIFEINKTREINCARKLRKIWWSTLYFWRGKSQIILQTKLASLAILFCKTRNIRRKFTQPFYNNKIRRFHFIFWPTDFSFQNSYNKVGITRHKYTHLCKIHKTHIFSSSKRGLFFFSLLSSQKSNKSKNRPFFSSFIGIVVLTNTNSWKTLR